MKEELQHTSHRKSNVAVFVYCRRARRMPASFFAATVIGSAESSLDVCSIYTNYAPSVSDQRISYCEMREGREISRMGREWGKTIAEKEEGRE